ncbi:hypothetical protein KIH41_15100 [Litoribacter ruber]|uniref:hypothetical protein n=1 Tax=Litoribacter ruber TaxID=702568 RepID=UPI001BD96109|nr:hypothetical protein [Litoribacter ruber]MBT0812614.1 hypothetical protein [Litoribacter ruber]
MGFIPIFLTLAGFVFLFYTVVENSLKNKQKAFEEKFYLLKERLAVQEHLKPTRANLVHLENIYLKKNPAEKEAAKGPLSQSKLYLYQYNRLLAKKPYNFVAKISGRQSI